VEREEHPGGLADTGKLVEVKRSPLPLELARNERERAQRARALVIDRSDGASIRLHRRHAPRLKG
jgi:hypothetical protein